jgi:hypothetical protein
MFAILNLFIQIILTFHSFPVSTMTEMEALAAAEDYFSQAGDLVHVGTQTDTAVVRFHSESSPRTHAGE